MIMEVEFSLNYWLEISTIKYIKNLFKSLLCSKNDYIKDTRMRRKYSGRKGKATGYALITGLLYRDAEGSPQHRSCLHYAIINDAPRIWGKIDQSELYRQCLPRRVMDTTIEDLEKYECVSYVMTIKPVLNIEREKWVP